MLNGSFAEATVSSISHALISDTIQPRPLGKIGKFILVPQARNLFCYVHGLESSALRLLTPQA